MLQKKTRQRSLLQEAAKCGGRHDSSQCPLPHEPSDATNMSESAPVNIPVVGKIDCMDSCSRPTRKRPIHATACGTSIKTVRITSGTTPHKEQLESVGPAMNLRSRKHVPLPDPSSHVDHILSSLAIPNKAIVTRFKHNISKNSNRFADLHTSATCPSFILLFELLTLLPFLHM